MDHDKTKTVRIEVSGKIVRQITLAQPATLSEIWHLPEVAAFGPSRMAHLRQDGVAYILVHLESYKAWKRMVEMGSSVR